MAQQQFTIELHLIDPHGKRWRVAMPIDSFKAFDDYIGLTPPHEFDGRTFNQTADLIRKKEYRKDDFERMAMQLARALGERMEDEEGWHGMSRQATYERRRKEGAD